MSTITREFTKEQLIEHLRTRIEHRSGLIANMHIDRGYRDYLKLELRSSEIALASLEAEPVAMRWRYLPDGIHGMGEWNYLDQGYIDTLNAYHLSREKELLYTAPPAPASVHENSAITQHFDTIALETAREIMCDVNRRQEFLGGDVQLLSRIQCRIDDACRDAMLQGGKS